MKKEMKKEMKNWNGTIELRPHWSSQTQAPKSPPEPLPASSQHAAQQSLHVCRCVADASQRLDFRPSFQGIHLYMVYTGAEIAARGPPSELTACCTPATGLQRRKHLRGVESLSVLSLGGAFAF